jgi:uracil-DNA glycosylase
VRLLLVGQAPARNCGKRAFDGRSGDRLAAYMGLDGRDELLARLECLNLLRRYPGSAGPKGDVFPRGKARGAARRLLRSLAGRQVLLAGKNVAEAFQIQDDYLVWGDHPEGFRFAVIPHPSGVNHWWNDEANRRRFRRWAGTVLREAA